MKTTKTSLTLLLASAGIVFAASLAAAPEPTTAMMCPVTAATKAGKAVIKPGTWRSDVLDLIGAPQERLTQDIWVYRQFHASLEAADANGCDRLVVAFTNGRVSSLRMANARAQAVIVARADSGARAPYVLLAAVEAAGSTEVATAD